jgi:hypothetical protein
LCASSFQPNARRGNAALATLERQRKIIPTHPEVLASQIVENPTQTIWSIAVYIMDADRLQVENWNGRTNMFRLYVISPAHLLFRLYSILVMIRE